MAWRPTQYLLEGELDNTTPGKVTGWMKFLGLDQTVSFDLDGNFHRDIRGAKIRFQGDGNGAELAEAREYMKGFCLKQTGAVGDITAGRPPADYVNYPYAEWYSEENGRAVIELEPFQVEIIGRPIPWQESDPISRDKQQQHMGRFLAGISQAMKAPAISVGAKPGIGSDPAFSHWVIEQGRIVGEARDVRSNGSAMSLAHVRLFHTPETAESGTIQTNRLLRKEL